MTFYIAIDRGRHATVDGFCAVAREPDTLVHALSQLSSMHGVMRRVTAEVIQCNYGTPYMPLNVDAMLIHPNQISWSMQTRSYTFVPQAYLPPGERRRVQFADRSRFLYTPGGSPISLTALRAEAYSLERPENDMDDSPSLSARTLMPEVQRVTHDPITRRVDMAVDVGAGPDKTATMVRTKDGKWKQAWPIPDTPKPVQVADARQRFVRRRRDA